MKQPKMKIHTPVNYLAWGYHLLFRSRMKFDMSKKSFHYFYHIYNTTWNNERAVEVPVVWNEVNRVKGKRLNVLEVGNVLSWYYKFEHDVVDLYDQKPGVLNEDITFFSPPHKYDLIISISTLEHVGWDELPKDPGKVLAAFQNLERLLSKTGRMIVTFPLGYNEYLDELWRDNRLPFTSQFCLKRVTQNNQWIETDVKEMKDIRYGYPFPAANGVVFGHLDKKSFAGGCS